MSVAVVTGANRGIGLELCRQLKEQSFKVYGVCREASKELEELGVEKIFTDVDVTNSESLQSLKKALTGQNVDLLINNAGVAHFDKWTEVDFELVQKQFQVNSIGPLKVTQALRDNLDKGSKIVMISSRMGSVEDNDSGGHYGYRMSKAALNAASKSLSIDLKPKGIAVFVLHPGYVQTRMTDNSGDMTPKESAGNILQTVEKLGLEQTGTFWHSRGEKLPW